MFCIEKDAEDKFRFYLKSDDKHVIVKSKTYSALNEVKDEIQHITQHTDVDRIYERKTSKDGKFYFNVLDKNLSTAAESQLYHSKAGLENGIKAAKKFAQDSEIKILF